MSSSSSKYHGRSISTLYIRNLSDRVRHEDLKRLFQKYGRVIDVTVPLDYYTHMPKGFCFVQYEDERDAEEALRRLDRLRLYGKEIEVEFARGDRKTPGEMRNRDRERRYTDRRRSRTRSRSRDRRRDRRDRSYSRSRSRTRTRSHSRRRSESPPRRERSVSRGRSRSPYEERDREPDRRRGGSRSRSRSATPVD